MSQMRAIRNILMACAVLAGGLAAGAQGPGMEPGFGPHRPPMERALGPRGAHGQWWNDPATVDRLKLTDDQRKSMDQILQRHRETLIDMRANVEKAEVALEPLMKADQPDETQILSQIDKVAQARAELEKANARFLLALRAKLTPDQWKQLQADRAERRDMRREWRQDRRGPRMAPPPPPAGGPPAAPDNGPGGQAGAAPERQSELQ